MRTPPAANTARPSAAVNNALEPTDVGTRVRAHSGQVHGDEPVGPQRRIAEQRLGAAAAVGVEIERQHHALAERAVNLPPIVDRGQALAADHQGRPERQPEGAIGDVGEAGIDPHRDAGQRVGNPAHQLEMIAGAGDGVEVGDIERGRIGDAQAAARAMATGSSAAPNGLAIGR